MGIAWGERIGIAQPPLVVDLDGTLVRTDLLIESTLALLRRNPLYLFLLPVWAARGKAYLKHAIASRVSLDVSTLPWRGDFIDYLRQQRADGRTIVLATGSDIRIAQSVADYLNLFDEVLATGGTMNLSGQAKRDVLVERFGERGFDYAADGAPGDLKIWSAARESIHVHPDAAPGLAGRLKVLRPSHWLKNLLLLVPLFAAHRFDELATLEKSVLAFVAFGCCASSGYLLNDLLDLEADRHHPQKRLRAFASGRVSLAYALAMIPILLGAGCILGALVSPLFPAVVLAYFVLSAAYSLRIKRVAILDVIFLAGLYTVRIMAGSVAIHIWLSHWLLAFTTFFFFSLALVKRYGELMIMRRVDLDKARARGYELSDAELLASMGAASGYLSVLVLALYIASDKARLLYGQREVLWFLCPLLLYWISHVWLTAHRGNMIDDPVVFATTDRTSRILILLMLATAVVAL